MLLAGQFLLIIIVENSTWNGLLTGKNSCTRIDKNSDPFIRALPDSYLLIFIVERAPHFQARILIGIVNDDVIAVSSYVHCAEEL